MASLERLLIDHDAGLLRLLDPPLARQQPSAGYIQAYPPGVRENGGQYSHAGVWALMAQAALGDGDAAYRSFTYLSPAHRSRHPARGAAYAIEPYVIAGDVYSAPPYVGRGGWSWYTGSAAWLQRAAIESMFGLAQRGDEISVMPTLPSAWDNAELRLTRAGKTVRIVFARTTSSVAAGSTPPTRLALGQTLRWSTLESASTWLVELPPVAAGGYAQPSATLAKVD
jgi:cyclic beta-1,2-glucan synthetase